MYDYVYLINPICGFLILVSNVLLIQHTYDKVTFVVIVWVVRILFLIAITEISPVGPQRQTVNLAVITVITGFEVNGEKVSFCVLERKVWVIILSGRKFRCHSIMSCENIKVRNQDYF